MFMFMLFRACSRENHLTGLEDRVQNIFPDQLRLSQGFEITECFLIKLNFIFRIVLRLSSNTTE